MKPIDYGAELDAKIGIAPQAASAAVNGTGIDATQYDGGVVACQVGAVTGTPTSYSVAFKVQDSPDNSTWTDANDADGNAVTASLTAAGIAKLRIDAGRLNQYVRVVATPSFTGGTSPTVLVSASALLGDKKYVG